MRVGLSVLLGALALALPASAGDVNPRALVLQPGDVSSGYRLDRNESGVQTNAALSKSDSAARGLIAHSGRISGYLTAYARKDSRRLSLWSWADLVRRPSGGRVILGHTDSELRNPSMGGFRRARLDIGEQGWLYIGRAGGSYVVVAWRQGRVFALVVAQGLSTDRTVALARAQERRIAAALR